VGSLIGEKTDCINRQQLMGGFVASIQMGLLYLGGDSYERYALYVDIDGDARPGWNEELGCNIGADEYRFPWILFNSVTTKKQ